MLGPMLPQRGCGEVNPPDREKYLQGAIPAFFEFNLLVMTLGLREGLLSALVAMAGLAAAAPLPMTGQTTSNARGLHGCVELAFC